ncbi:MAG TPA: leucine-rich repeat protein [Candidatus Limadaptatus stercoripullorum]|uniref:Leucine-rich repeat protein n=1 Tax=Candidatus Limadaptatus stercoripullorum TaxID=2840846 RepID=A0A9D1NBA7_9FIRM|nr:leucine-rich repeat protein [Candidatus Limadaptatus stercoripullorum]
MTDNNNTKDDRNKLSAVWNAAPSGIGLDDRITIIENWSYEALKYLPPWIMPEAIESDGYYFVAHSREDFKIVYTDILRLESVGVDIWYDRAMEPSKDWRELAKRMMNRQECKGVIVYGTVNSMASKPVQAELLVADELGKNIIFINHGEDLKTTAAKYLYEEACKDKAAKEAEETTKEDRKRVKAFKDLLTRIGNANITYIDLAHSAARKKEQLDAIKPEEVLIYESMFKSASVVGVKYLGVKSVKIPENVTIDGKEYNMIQIGACAFANCRALEKIELPETLEQIGEHAFFGCASLTKVHLGRNVWYVAENAFENCAKLEDVTIADDNKYIIVEDRVCYSYQYDEDSLGIFFVPRDLEGDIALLDGLKTIKRDAFSWRIGITAVTIPDSVTSIGNYAFCNCTSLTSVTIGNGVTSIRDCAFMDCVSLEAVYITDIGKWAAISFDDADANPVFSADLYLNGELATELVIPESVTRIGQYAFIDCISLISVTIPNTVTNIENSAFCGCTALTSISIPDSVTSIEDSAFGYCTSLTSVTIPDSVTSIGSGAFRDCSSLISVTIPNSVTSIGDYAFGYCTSLTSITIPNSVTSIGDWAFRGCNSLTSVTIPNSVTSIGENAFRFCRSLRHVTYSGTVRQWKKLTAKCPGWAADCPCEVVKCKDGEVPLTAEDRGA